VFVQQFAGNEGGEILLGQLVDSAAGEFIEESLYRLVKLQAD